MLTNKVVSALAASVLLNCGCVALVGEAASRRSAPHPPRSAASLHPAALQMAADPKPAGPDDGIGKPDGGSGESGGSAARSGIGSPREAGGDAVQSESSQANLSRPGQSDLSRPGQSDLSRPGGKAVGREAAKTEQDAVQLKRDAKAEAQSAKLEAQSAKLEAQSAKLEARLEQRLLAGQRLSPAQQQTLSRLRQQTAQQQAARQQTAQQAGTHAGNNQSGLPGLNQRRIASARGVSGQSEAALRRQLSLITQSSVPARSSHASSPGSAIAPKMITYPKMTVDLGTVHLTRPQSGITGGGSSDQRQVSIKVHYVVDDPKNVPKTLKPDRIIKRFATNCKGDPGNTSHCLPTGGNTRLGGTTLHGKHDQITGVKYCVPGSGGIAAAGGSSQSRQRRGATQEKPGAQTAGHGKEYGKLAGFSQTISEPYHGLGAAYPITLNGRHGGHLNPNEVMATELHASHLPGKASDDRGLVPGAEVPMQDRKWVSDPQAHLAAALPGPQAVPLPRFQVSPRSIGSLSRFGTINWGRPVKTPRKKQPLGGDGTGLLGTYYRGNNFQQLVFTRPDRNIDFDWSAAPPDPRFGRTEEYTVRWLGKLVPQVTDTYTLMASSDDGVRVYLDGKLLVSNWSVHGPSEDTAMVRLVAGRKYDIKIEYFENGYGVAVMKLYWESPHVPREYLPEQDLRYPK